MKIQKSFTTLFIIYALIARQPSFGMELITKELKPTHTISIKSGFVVHNIAFDKNDNKLNLFTQHNSNSLPKNLGDYTLDYKDKITDIWSTVTRQPLYTLSHCAPILCAHLNNSKTQLITASNDGNNNIVNIWRLKKTINSIYVPIIYQLKPS